MMAFSRLISLEISNLVDGLFPASAKLDLEVLAYC